MSTQQTDARRVETAGITESAAVIVRSTARGHALARFALPAIFLALIVIFSILRPDTFASSDNLRTTLITQSVLAVVAIAVLLPLIIGEFDLSVGANLGLGVILTTGLSAKQGLPLGVAAAIAVLSCTGVGLINGFFVARIGINAFIATLGTGTVLSGAVLWYTDARVISENVPTTLVDLSSQDVLGVPTPALAMFLVALVVWYVLEHTPLGRYCFAVGGSKDAARLSGLNVSRLTYVAFMTSGFLAGIGGLMAASQLGSGNPDVGPSYLLPAFAAAFLGATAIRVGSFNVLGTLFAVFTIAVGITGLQLMGAPFYIEPIFNGMMLLIAVVATRYLQRERV
jgi:ribose transport system permease protein